MILRLQKLDPLLPRWLFLMALLLILASSGLGSRYGLPQETAPSKSATPPSMSNQQLFNLANKLQQVGKNDEAIFFYEQLLRNGVNELAVFYNLGTCYLHTDRRGWARYYLSLASRLAPRDQALRNNLHYLKDQTEGGSADWDIDSPLSPLHWLNLNEWSFFWLIPTIGIFCGLCLSEWKPEWKSRLKSFLFVCTGLFLVLTICLILALHFQYNINKAIIVAESAPVRHGPLAKAKIAYDAPDGSRLRLVGKHSNWYQVVHPEYGLGWVSNQHAVLLLGHSEFQPAVHDSLPSEVKNPDRGEAEFEIPLPADEEPNQ